MSFRSLARNRPDRAAGVGADLRVGDVAVRRPGRPRRIEREQLRRDADEQRLAVGPTRRRPPGRPSGRCRAARSSAWTGRPSPFDDAAALAPRGRECSRPRRRSERQDRDRERRAETGKRGRKHPDQQPATGESGLLRERRLEVGRLRRGRGSRMPLLDHGRRDHQRLCPEHDSDPECPEGDAEQDALRSGSGRRGCRPRGGPDHRGRCSPNSPATTSSVRDLTRDVSGARSSG